MTAAPLGMVPIVGVDPAGSLQFLDAEGRLRLLRGMAVTYKAPPYIPTTDSFHPVTSFAEQDIQQFKRLNLNLIRLGVPWAAVQPRPDSFDEEYLARVLDLVRSCERAGLYVVIEAHQDLYSSDFGGNGMPSWSVTRDFWTLPFPLPIRLAVSKTVDSSWGKYYASHACTRAFYGLYNDERVQGAFVGYWEKLAKTFAGEPNVLGYELLNEPFICARSTLGVPYGLLKRKATERQYLVPLYDRLARAIRRIDPRALILYEPATGGGRDSGDGFTQPPAGDKNKGVMAFHSYGPNAVDGHTMEESIVRHTAQVTRIGGGALLSEWDCEFDRGTDRIQQVMELCDRHGGLSWIGWQYKEFVNICGSPPSATLFDPATSQLRPDMVKLFSRPFPAIIAGQLVDFEFAWDTSTFHLRYIPAVESSLLGRTTVIAVSRTVWGAWNVIVVGDAQDVAKVTVDQSDLQAVKLVVGQDWTPGQVLVVQMTLE